MTIRGDNLVLKRSAFIESKYVDIQELTHFSQFGTEIIVVKNL